jgi:hypothetical protein
MGRRHHAHRLLRARGGAGLRGGAGAEAGAGVGWDHGQTGAAGGRAAQEGVGPPAGAPSLHAPRAQGLGAPPERPPAPLGPKVQDNTAARKSQNRTYADLVRGARAPAGEGARGGASRAGAWPRPRLGSPPCSPTGRQGCVDPCTTSDDLATRSNPTTPPPSSRTRWTPTPLSTTAAASSCRSTSPRAPRPRSRRRGCTLRSTPGGRMRGEGAGGSRGRAARLLPRRQVLP